MVPTLLSFSPFISIFSLCGPYRSLSSFLRLCVRMGFLNQRGCYSQSGTVTYAAVFVYTMRCLLCVVTCFRSLLCSDVSYQPFSIPYRPSWCPNWRDHLPLHNNTRHVRDIPSRLAAFFRENGAQLDPRTVVLLDHSLCHQRKLPHLYCTASVPALTPE